jgi:hypothetical protein
MARGRKGESRMSGRRWKVKRRKKVALRLSQERSQVKGN